MVQVIKSKEGIGIGFSSASEFLSVMDFIQEIYIFAKESIENDEGPWKDMDSVEELIGRMCVIQLTETAKQIQKNPEMLEEMKIAASQECSGSRRKDYNDAMYG